MKRTVSLMALASVVMVLTTPAQAGEVDLGLERILADAAPDQTVSVLVYLEDQVDLGAINDQLTEERVTRKRRHETVVYSLMDVVAATQGPLNAYLQELQDDGQVERLQAFWIANCIRVDATKAIIEAIAAHPGVGTVYFNYPIESIPPVGDASRAGGGNTRGGGGRAPTIGLTAVRAPEAWALGYDGDGILVATLDTGVDGNHPALASRWRGVADPRYVDNPEWAWFDPVTNTTFPQSFGSHGTHTMGSVCGGAPGEQIGVAPGAQWIHAGVIDRVSISQTVADAILSFQWMLDPNEDPSTNWDVPHVCSNSWRVTTGHGYPPCDETFWTYLDACHAAGIVILFSAGNEGPGSGTVGRPPDRATDEYRTCAIGAVNANNSSWPIAGFSSRGPTFCAPGGAEAIKPDLVAPGVAVYSSVPGGGYQSSGWDGTSMSSPHVNGVAALIRQACPDLTVEQVIQIMYDTAFDLGPAGEDNSYGYGMVDAYESVLMAEDMCGPHPPEAFDMEVTTAISTLMTITLLAEDDSLPEPPVMTFTINSLPTQGDLSDPGNGPISSVPYTLVSNGNQVDYTPDFDYAGPDSFDFKASDGGVPPEGGDSNIAVVSITVGGAAWDPVAYNTNASTALSTSTDISLWASDPNSDTLTYIIESLPAQGTLSDPDAGAIVAVPYTLVGGGEIVTYMPPPDQYLQEPFGFSVRDATAGSNLASVSVTVGGPMWDPVAQDMLWGTAVSLPTDIELSASDPNGDPLTYFVESLPDVGGLSDPGAGPISSVPYTLVGGGNTVTFTPPWGQTIQTMFDFSVRDATAASNVATVTVDVGVEHAVYNFLLDSSPGWATSGQWAFGQPTGGGSGNGDPTSGHTGNNVYGYNLNGDYEDNMQRRYLTTGPIDCTYLVNTELQFWRKLGVEHSSFDGANIQISTNGLMWSDIWVHDGPTIDDASWSFHAIDISATADGRSFVFLRWGIGPTDVAPSTHFGWNLDDIALWGLDTTPVPLPCDQLTYTPGDMNLDGSVNGLDVQTMVQMVLNPAGAWQAEQLCAGDFTNDDAVTLADVDAFVLELLN